MESLAYALMGCLLVLAAPWAAADCSEPNPPDEGEPGGDCDVFAYQLDPPAYRIDPGCLLTGG